jgi:phospho-N-acetylmuramoyl-pentapeptide-transferase
MLYQLYLWLVGPKGYAPESPLFRATIAALLAFGIVWALGPRVIRQLIKLKIGDRPEFDHATLNELTKDKRNTPTMGGVLIVAAVAISILLLANIRNFYVTLALFCLGWLALLGGVDDWLKLTAHRRSGSRDGLRLWEKLVFQVALGALLVVFIQRTGKTNVEESRWRDPAAPYIPYAHVMTVPFYKGEPVGPLYPMPDGSARQFQGVILAWWAFPIIAIIVIAGTSNAVNLTDGMDGLASGCVVLTAFAFMILAAVVSSPGLAYTLLLFHVPGAEELSVICGAVVGACMGFLWYNAYPAQVFMGDTGSLPLGGLIGYIAIVTRLELMLFLVGGVFVIEALSVLIQIGYYKGTGGKRVFRCAPIHHHFHLGGWTETQTVVRFWLLAAVFAAFALASIKLR